MIKKIVAQLVRPLLLSLVLISSVAFARIQYRYERDLVAVFDDMEGYSFEEKCAVTNHALAWLKTILDENATGRRSITKKDKEYIARISYMLCFIYNDTEYMGNI